MFRTVYQSVKKNMTVLLLLLPAVLVCLPVVLIITGSVMDSIELKQYLYPVFGGGEEFIRWKLMPDYPTFEHYGRLLFLTPAFFVLFWNSVRMVVCILIGQMIVGGAGGLGVCGIPGAGQQDAVCALCGADVTAVSGDHVVQLSGA